MNYFNRLETKQLSAGLALAGGMLALSGCTSRSVPPKASYPICHAVKANQWTRVPGNANLQNIAPVLGVSQAQVAAGKFGGAVCDVAVSANIVKDPVKVTVDGISDVISTCLVIGFQTGNQVPDANKSYTGILAVCPAATIAGPTA